MGVRGDTAGLAISERPAAWSDEEGPPRLGWPRDGQRDEMQTGFATTTPQTPSQGYADLTDPEGCMHTVPTTVQGGFLMASLAQIRESRLSRVRSLAQGHSANKQLSRDLTVSAVTPEPGSLPSLAWGLACAPGKGVQATQGQMSEQQFLHLLGCGLCAGRLEVRKRERRWGSPLGSRGAVGAIRWA